MRDDNEGLTALDGTRGKALVAFVLLNSKRFAGKRRLVNLEVGILGHDAAVSGNDRTLHKTVSDGKYD